MSLSSNTVLEVRSGGSDTNSGGFVTGSSGTDFSQQNAAQYTLTSLTTAAANAIILTASAAAVMVGNLINITAGTNFTVGWYQILSVSVGVSITVDRNCTTAAGAAGTGNIGGAFASPGLASSIMQVVGMQCFIKYSATPYTLSTATAGTSGGPIKPGDAVTVCGYDTTRTIGNLDANRPTLLVGVGVTSTILLTTPGGSTNAYVGMNLILDGNSVTGSQACFGSTMLFRCKITGMKSTGSAIVYYFCEAVSNTVAIFQGLANWCVAHANTATPFNSAAYNCISYGNTGGSTDGFGRECTNCIAYGNGRNGFTPGGTNFELWLVNCIAEANAGFGYNVARAVMYNCASYNNTSGRITGAMGGSSPDIAGISGSGSFFINAASANFALNNTAGAGALCRAASIPSLFADGLTSNYLDIGSAQHQDPVSSITTRRLINGGLVGV